MLRGCLLHQDCDLMAREPEYILQAGAKEFQAGLQPSLPNRQPVFWLRGANVLFHEQAIQSLPGFELLFTDKPNDHMIKGMGAVTIDTIPNLFYGTDTNLYRYRPGSGVLSKGSGYTTPQRWIIEPYGQFMLATNNNNPVQIYKESVGNFADLGGTTTGPAPFTKALIIARNRAFQFCINTDFDHRGVHWSGRDNPEAWDGTIHATAGYVSVREADSEINGAIQLDQDLILACNYTVHVVNFIQSPYMYGVSKIMDGVGAVGPRAMVTANRVFYSLGFDFIWQSNGVTYEPISTPNINRFIYSDINTNMRYLVEGWHLASHSCVLWFYPSHNSEVNNRLVGYNYKTGAWTIWGFGQSAVEDNLVFGRALFGSEVGDVTYMNFERQEGVGKIGYPMTLKNPKYRIGAGFGHAFGMYFGGFEDGTG